jgi:transposase
LGLSHGGIGTKLHLSTDAAGLPIGMVVTSGNRNECPTFASLIDATRERSPRHRLPKVLVADKGYSADRIRDWLKRRRVKAVIPMRANEHLTDGRREREPFDKEAYRGRNAVERCVGRLKNCRRICTRYEKLAVNFGAMVTLAMISIYLRLPLGDRT